MSDFRTLSADYCVAPQISIEDIAEAKAAGFAMVINNRPEGETPDQTSGDEIEAAARAAGMDYLYIPVTHAGFSEAQVKAMADAMTQRKGPVLAYCRSGTRSTLLWSLAEASRGRGVDEIASAAACGGYDVAPIRQLMEMLAARS